MDETEIIQHVAIIRSLLYVVIGLSVFIVGTLLGAGKKRG